MSGFVSGLRRSGKDRDSYPDIASGKCPVPDNETRIFHGVTRYWVDGPLPDFSSSPSSTKWFRCRLAVRSSLSIAAAYSEELATPLVASHCQPSRSDFLKFSTISASSVVLAAAALRNNVSTRYGSCHVYLGNG